MLEKLHTRFVLVILMGIFVFAGSLLREQKETFAEEPLQVYYSACLYQNGWSHEYQDNTLLKAPAGSYMTAFRAGLMNQPGGMTGTVAYQVNLSQSGWLDWVDNMAETGGVEGELPLESIRFKLTGQLADLYDIYYCVFQNGAWTPWVTNEAAGVEGAGLRVDGIKVSVVGRGTGEPPATPRRVIDPNRPMVALTFDDGPNGPVTNRILDSLEANGGRATFFMVGSRVQRNTATVRRMGDMGCEVGNHTYGHRYLTDLGSGGVRYQVGLTNQRIAEACGVTPVLVRPPGGFYNVATLNRLRSMGMSVVMWSVDTLDWKTCNAQQTVSAVLDHVQDGDVVLMHDLYGATADAAERIIPELTARGYQLVTVSELASLRGGVASGQAYSQFRR